MANRLPTETRVQILNMLCEGVSMRAISRMTGVSTNTVDKLLVDAGMACVRHHDEAVRNVKCQRIQADEIWSFVYAKQKNVKSAKAAPENAGDVWTWTALDSDSKLLVSYMVGDRNAEYALSRLLPASRARSLPISKPVAAGFRWKRLFGSFSNLT